MRAQRTFRSWTRLLARNSNKSGHAPSRAAHPIWHEKGLLVPVLTSYLLLSNLQMSLRARQIAGGASPSLAQGGRSLAQVASDSKSTTFPRLSHGEEALADTNPQQSAGPALAPADSKLIQLEAQAAADAAQLAHFHNLNQTCSLCPDR
jgi:hypothetical protein